jgi:protein-disulfide isomerase
MPKILSLALFLLCVTAIVPAVAADQSPTLTPQDHVLGKATAPVAIIEYASLTCPHCAAFEQESYPTIKKDWVDTGKAKYVYRDFPLDRYALLASAIARCAPQDRYFAFIQSFFDSQENWVTAADPLAALKGIARLGGMNVASVDKCLADTKLQEAIVQMEAQAKDDYGVNSTPTFFIIGANGTTKLIGEQPYADFSKALAAASPKS